MDTSPVDRELPIVDTSSLQPIYSADERMAQNAENIGLIFIQIEVKGIRVSVEVGQAISFL